MPAIKCPKCGEFNKDDQLQCKKCGTPIPQINVNVSRPQPHKAMRPGDMAPGQVLANRFSILQLIGRGGMGSIYKVEDKILGETVAVKTLLPQFASDQTLVDRFFNEARIARRLSHPNIVRVHDIGSTGAVIYISMELLSGRSLREVLEAMAPGQRLPISETLRIVDELCQALEYAHQFTIHRDIKPENVMLTGDGTVKLMDFGISKLMANTRLTQQSMVMGTPFYMSPEQLRNSRDVDARADIFSVGVMLYEILTGNLPSGVPKPASEMMEDIPPALDNIVSKCVDPDPERRFQNATELRSALTPIRELLETGAKRTFLKAGPKINGKGASVGEVGGKMAGVVLLLFVLITTFCALYFVEQLRVSKLKAAEESTQTAATPLPNNPEDLKFSDLSTLRDMILAHTPSEKRAAANLSLHYEQGDKLWAQAVEQKDTALGHRIAREAIQYEIAPLIWPERMKFVAPGTLVLDGESLLLDAFFVDETEVTLKDFYRFCNEVEGGWRPEFTQNYNESYGDYPISSVTFYDALAYSVWAKKDLPTRAQWCMAAFGSEKAALYPWGNEWSPDAANTFGSREYAGPVQVKSNPKDTSWTYCVDMSGNVAEWTKTPSDKQLALQSPDPDFGMLLAVCGGHYESERVTFQDYMAVKFETQSPYIGLRCIKNIPSTPKEIYLILSNLS